MNTDFRLTEQGPPTFQPPQHVLEEQSRRTAFNLWRVAALRKAVFIMGGLGVTYDHDISRLFPSVLEKLSKVLVNLNVVRQNSLCEMLVTCDAEEQTVEVEVKYKAQNSDSFVRVYASLTCSTAAGSAFIAGTQLLAGRLDVEFYAALKDILERYTDGEFS